MVLRRLLSHKQHLTCWLEKNADTCGEETSNYNTVGSLDSFSKRPRERPKKISSNMRVKCVQSMSLYVEGTEVEREKR